MEFKDNAIEFYTGSRIATVTFTNKKHVNRIKKLYASNKEDFEYFFENQDGSVCARIPLKWIKINPGSKNKRVLTEAQKEAGRLALEKYRNDKKTSHI